MNCAPHLRLGLEIGWADRRIAKNQFWRNEATDSGMPAIKPQLMVEGRPFVDLDQPHEGVFVEEKDSLRMNLHQPETWFILLLNYVVRSMNLPPGTG
jgi:hypothetical protein